MNKEGQFYLLAAIVIISLTLGFVAVFNYSKSPELTRVYDVEEELEIESGKFLDREALTGTYDWVAFTQTFSGYAGKDINIIYVLQEGNDLSPPAIFRYDEGGDIQFDIDNSVNGDLVNVTWENTYYYFKLRQGKDFYFIVSQYIEGERYVATN